MGQDNWEMDCLDVDRGREPEDGLYTKEEFEDTMANIRARIPTMKLDTIERRSHTSKMYGRNSCSSASFRRM